MFKSILEEEKDTNTGDMNGTIILSKATDPEMSQNDISGCLPEVSGSDISGPDISGIEELPRDSVVPELPQESTSLSPAVNNGLRRGTFTVDSNRAVAKVSPMVPERPKGKLFLDAQRSQGHL